MIDTSFRLWKLSSITIRIKPLPPALHTEGLSEFQVWPCRVSHIPISRDLDLIQPRTFKSFWKNYLRRGQRMTEIQLGLCRMGQRQGNRLSTSWTRVIRGPTVCKTLDILLRWNLTEKVRCCYCQKTQEKKNELICSDGSYQVCLWSPGNLILV